MATKIATLDTTARVRQIRRQIVDTQEDIFDMRATFVRIGEEGDWDDPRLEALDRAIARFEGRVAALRQELRMLAQDGRTAHEPAESEWDEPRPPAA